MENNMKNFDRLIEQRLNEQETPPPFGAWNRIAAELDAMPMAAAEPAPVSRAIPKRVITSFIAGMLIMGAAIATGFWVNSTLNDTKNAANANTNTKPVNVSSTVNNTVSANDIGDGKHNLNVAVAVPVAKAPVTKTMNTMAAVKPAAQKNISESLVNTNTVSTEFAANTVSDVPSPMGAVAMSVTEVKEVYYFPPVDVVSPEKCKTENNDLKIAKEDLKPNTDDDRGTTSKVKFKPPRRHAFRYGHLNRM